MGDQEAQNGESSKQKESRAQVGVVGCKQIEGRCYFFNLFELLGDYTGEADVRHKNGNDHDIRHGPFSGLENQEPDYFI